MSLVTYMGILFVFLKVLFVNAYLAGITTDNLDCFDPLLELRPSQQFLSDAGIFLC